MKPDDGLPPAVKAQLATANAIQSQIAGQGEQPTPAATHDLATETTVLPVTAEQAPALKIVEPAEVVRPAAEAEETWEQRYKSFKGHADAELRRAHGSVEKMRDDNADLRASLKTMQEQLDKLANPPAPEPDPPKGATDADIESFGADQVSFTQRVVEKSVADAQLVMNAKLQGLMSAIDEMRGTVTQVDERATLSAEALFFKDLRDAVPDFEDLNNTQGWKEWLQGMDLMSGSSRQELLSQAQAQLAVDRVVAIFDNFKRETGIGDASATSTQHTTQANDLESQLSPQKSKTTQVVSQQPEGAERIWTQAEIADVYNRQARGKIDAEEFKALEMEINRAVQTNRVR